MSVAARNTVLVVLRQRVMISNFARRTGATGVP